MRFGQSGVRKEEIILEDQIRNFESNSEDGGEVKKTPSVISDEPEGYDDSLSIADNTIDTDDLIDYPEGISRYVSAADNSCSDFALTQTFRARRKLARETC